MSVAILSLAEYSILKELQDSKILELTVTNEMLREKIKTLEGQLFNPDSSRVMLFKARGVFNEHKKLNIDGIVWHEEEQAKLVRHLFKEQKKNTLWERLKEKLRLKLSKK